MVLLFYSFLVVVCKLMLFVVFGLLVCVGWYCFLRWFRLYCWYDTVFALATPDQPTAEDLLSLFFSLSEESRAKGAEYLQRATSGKRTATPQPTSQLATPSSPRSQPGASRIRRGSTAWPASRNPRSSSTATTIGCAHEEQPPTRRAAPKRRAPNLPRCEPRLPRPIPGAVRRRHRGVPQPLADRRPGGVNTSKKGSTCPTN